MDIADSVSKAAITSAPKSAKAERIAELIRQAGGYRWVGIYEVSDTEIAILAWTGPDEPAHPRFPVDRGLCGAAVAAGQPVIVDDITADPRYLTTFGSTQSELVVPVSDEDGRVRGLVDIESDRRAAFGPEDVRLVSECAAAALPLWLDQ